MEYENKRQDLIEEAKETKQEIDQKQNEALKAIESGQDLEKYETVELGELELEVKGWIPGGMMEDINEAKRLAERDSPEDVMDSINTMLSVLEDMTTDEAYSMAFWRKYFQQWGPQGLQLAIQSVLEPAQKDLEQQQEAVKSFRG